ncbi:MAG: hypothetical protein AAF622_00995 [Cyanobacteria bacterium P01_C01_bin.147]
MTKFSEGLLEKFKPKLIFWILVALVYTTLFFATDQLGDPLWGDEASFYKTSQQFSHQLIPTFEQLRDYGELNTPLPFILFGQIQYLFQGGVFGGRLLNFGLSIIIAILIGRPRRQHEFASILALVGLFLYPYFLWFSTRYYTDIIAAFLTLLGIIFYLRELRILSSLVFVLAIAARQYMLAFPLAVASHELLVAIQKKKYPNFSFWGPAIAAFSILVWFVLFGGLTPPNVVEANPVPIQQTLFAIAPSHGLYALASIGLFYVIPEWVLFNRSLNWRASDWRASLTNRKTAIAIGLVSLCIIFPIPEFGRGVLWNLFGLTSNIGVSPFFLYCGLVVITGWRFSQTNLSLWLVIYHILIMTKAFPWDKYTLPILVLLWFLKAHDTSKQAERNDR